MTKLHARYATPTEGWPMAVPARRGAIIDLAEAIECSCNVYFLRAAHRAGREAVAA